MSDLDLDYDEAASITSSDHLETATVESSEKLSVLEELPLLSNLSEMDFDLYIPEPCSFPPDYFALTDSITTDHPSAFCECLLAEVVELALVEAIDIKNLLEVESFLFDNIELVDIMDQIVEESILIVLELETLQCIENARTKFRESLLQIYNEPLPEYESIKSSLNIENSTLDLFKTPYTSFIRDISTELNTLIYAVDSFLECLDDLEDVEQVVNVVKNLSSATSKSLKDLSSPQRKLKKKAKGKVKKMASSSTVDVATPPKSVAISILDLIEPEVAVSPSSYSSPYRITSPIPSKEASISISPQAKRNVGALRRLNKLYVKTQNKSRLTALPIFNELAQTPQISAQEQELIDDPEYLENPELFIQDLDHFSKSEEQLATILEICRSSFFKNLPLSVYISCQEKLNSPVLDVFWFIRTLLEFCACTTVNDILSLDMTSFESTYISGQGEWLSVYASCRIGNFLNSHAISELPDEEVVLWTKFLGKFVLSLTLKSRTVTDKSVALLTHCCPNIQKLDLSQSNVTDSGLVLLKEFVSLYEVNISDTLMSSSSVAEFSKNCSNLVVVGEGM
ncbi:hypothetical protein RCL1_007790 [Eukaryota sp. TZLM3-RCL]